MQNLTKDISRIHCMYFHVFKSPIVFANPRTYLSIGSNSELLNEKTLFIRKVRVHRKSQKMRNHSSKADFSEFTYVIVGIKEHVPNRHTVRNVFTHDSLTDVRDAFMHTSYAA